MTFPRLDRLFTVAFSRGRPSVPMPRRGAIPILMYHSISGTPLPGRSAYHQIHTRPETFRMQMGLLAGWGFQVVTLSRAAALLASSGELPHPCAVITFDDGYRDFATSALPVLEQAGFPATVFVAAGLAGRRPAVFHGRSCLGWDEIRSLADRGIEFGSHSLSHSPLGRLGPARLEDEIRISKEVIEERTGRPVGSFSFPYAFPRGSGFRRAAGEILGAAGYECGVTTSVGLASPRDGRFFLRRIPANDLDDALFFREKIRGAYDWVNRFQAAKKAVFPPR